MDSFWQGGRLQFDVIELPRIENPTIEDYCMTTPPRFKPSSVVERHPRGFVMTATPALDCFLAAAVGEPCVEPSVYDMFEGTPLEMSWS